jgi:hypothetical protein
MKSTLEEQLDKAQSILEKLTDEMDLLRELVREHLSDEGTGMVRLDLLEEIRMGLLQCHDIVVQK